MTSLDIVEWIEITFLIISILTVFAVASIYLHNMQSIKTLINEQETYKKRIEHLIHEHELSTGRLRLAFVVTSQLFTQFNLSRLRREQINDISSNRNLFPDYTNDDLERLSQKVELEDRAIEARIREMKLLSDLTMSNMVLLNELTTSFGDYKTNEFFNLLEPLVIDSELKSEIITARMQLANRLINIRIV